VLALRLDRLGRPLGPSPEFVSSFANFSRCRTSRRHVGTALWGEGRVVVVHALPIQAKSAEHGLDGDVNRGLAGRAYDVKVLAAIILVQISWLSLLVYAAVSLFG
jgi:hypothetical protein